MVKGDFFEIRQRKWKNRFFGKYNLKEFLNPYLKPDGKHLDFGCGFGNYCFLLSQEYPWMKVYGYDKDALLIKKGKQNFKSKNLHLGTGPTFKTKLRYDSISLFNVIHELEKPEQQLKIFYELLNRGGNIIIYDFRKAAKKDFVYWYDRKKKINEYGGDFEEEYNQHCKFSVAKLKQIMESAGFKTVVSQKTGNLWLWYIGKKIKY